MGRIGAIVALACADRRAYLDNKEELQTLAHNLAKHIIAMNPAHPDHSSAGPQLVDQSYFMDDSKTVNQVLESVSQKLQSEVRVRDFIRFECGEP